MRNEKPADRSALPEYAVRLPLMFLKRVDNRLLLYLDVLQGRSVGFENDSLPNACFRVHLRSLPQILDDGLQRLKPITLLLVEHRLIENFRADSGQQAGDYREGGHQLAGPLELDFRCVAIE